MESEKVCLSRGVGWAWVCILFGMGVEVSLQLAQMLEYVEWSWDCVWWKSNYERNSNLLK